MRYLPLVTTAAMLVMAGCAVSPEEDPVQIRMNDLDTRLQRIERVVTNQSLLDMAQRIEGPMKIRICQSTYRTILNECTPWIE